MKAKIKNILANKLFRLLASYAGAIAIGLIISLIIKSTVHPVVVSGHSMNPTYQSGDVLKCNISFDIDDIGYGDVITFTHDSERYIKRVIALPNDTIEIFGGKVYVNGKESEYQFEAIDDAGILECTALLLGDNEFFCIGDNRNNSVDCRKFGPIQFGEIDNIIVSSLF